MPNKIDHNQLTMQKQNIIIITSKYVQQYNMFENIFNRRENMKKKVKKLFTAAILGGLGFLAVKLCQKDEVQDKLMSWMGEDLFLAVLSKVRLAGDVLAWPIHFVAALLP